MIWGHVSGILPQFSREATHKQTLINALYSSSEVRINQTCSASSLKRLQLGLVDFCSPCLMLSAFKKKKAHHFGLHVGLGGGLEPGRKRERPDRPERSEARGEEGLKFPQLKERMFQELRRISLFLNNECFVLQD